MRNILLKELSLSASPLSFIFILFGLMFFLPGYPVLCGVFFVTLGIFQSFQNSREANDIVFSALLPIAKRDVVKGKYLFVCVIELCSLLLMTGAVMLRMTLLIDIAQYRSNALMNANLFALGAALFIFGLFNLIFVGGFFKTAYKFARPFVCYIIVCFSVICLAESVHYIPKLGFFNAFGFEHIYSQLLSLIAGTVLYVLITYFSFIKSCKNFENTDL